MECRLPKDDLFSTKFATVLLNWYIFKILWDYFSGLGMDVICCLLSIIGTIAQENNPQIFTNINKGNIYINKKVAKFI